MLGCGEQQVHNVKASAGSFAGFAVNLLKSSPCATKSLLQRPIGLCWTIAYGMYESGAVFGGGCPMIGLGAM